MVAEHRRLPDLPEEFQRHDGQRYGRPARHHGKARLSEGARCRRGLAHPRLPVPHDRQRLRHQRLHGHQSRFWLDAPDGGADRRRKGARHPHHHGSRLQPQFRSASVVPEVALQPHQRKERLVHLARPEGGRQCADELARHLRRLCVDILPRARAVLPAHLCRGAARSQLGEPGGTRRPLPRRELLARQGRRRIPHRRDHLHQETRRLHRRHARCGRRHGERPHDDGQYARHSGLPP